MAKGTYRRFDLFHLPIWMGTPGFYQSSLKRMFSRRKSSLNAQLYLVLFYCFFFISPHIDVLSLCQITHVINVLLAIISQMKLLIVKGACSLY